MDGGMATQLGDRAGIHCRTVTDAAQVLDAVKGYETADMYTAIPKGLIPPEPYTSFVVEDAVASEAAQGHADRYRARVHGEAHEE